MSVIAAPLVLLNILLAVVRVTIIPAVLQVFLARTKSRWPGLILPVLSFVSSIPITLVFMFNIQAMEGEVLGAVLTLLVIWLLYNIPTIILLVIYFICRRTCRKKQQEKMDIQDL